MQITIKKNKTFKSIFKRILIFIVCTIWVTFSFAEQSSNTEQAVTEDRFFMLNALWFKEDGGAEMYNEYLRALAPFTIKYGAIIHESYVPQESLIGTFDADLLFYAEWPSTAAFMNLTKDPGYLEIVHLRREAITKSLLIKLRRL
jgi:uncharacterized protein (DUF1330 family)